MKRRIERMSRNQKMIKESRGVRRMLRESRENIDFFEILRNRFGFDEEGKDFNVNDAMNAFYSKMNHIKEQISNMFNDMIHDNRYFDFEYDEEEDIVADSIEIEINDKWFESAVETYLDSLVSDGYATNDGEYYHLVSEED